MPRILGVILDEKKQVRIALTNIYGIGKTLAKKICDELSINDITKISDLDKNMIKILQDKVATFQVEGSLRSKIKTNIKRLKDIKCYKGMRHKKFLPVNGQRTKTNAKTRKRVKK